jgi:hypothetical protein
MKIKLFTKEHGSVLLVTLLTITIMTLICATTLYIGIQNTSSGMQTAGWQQSLMAAEAGIDAAIRALNSTSASRAWTNWRTVSSALPTSGAGYSYEPASGSGSAASGLPSSSQYNYLPSTNLTINSSSTEGAASVTAWTTIDTAGASNLVSSGQQWYRIRSTGQTVYSSGSPLLKRVSNNRLDNDLRNTLAMNFNRKGGTTKGPTRTIEVIVNPLPGNAAGLTLKTWLVMSGSGTVDAFNSPNGVWSQAYRDTSYPLVVAEGNTSNQAKFSNNNQAYVYGGVVYSGNPPQNTNTSTVLGQVSTPDNITIPTPSDPTQVNSSNISWTYQNPWNPTYSPWGDSSTSLSGTWTSNGGGASGTYPATAGTYATLTGGGSPPANNGVTVTSITANGTAGSPELIIINGDFNLSGSNSLTINPTTVTQNGTQVTSPSNSYVIIWVKGKFTLSGQSSVTQANGTHVAWIVDGDINISGQTYYNNLSSTSAVTSFVGIGNHALNYSGQDQFTATVNAPSFTNNSISGAGDVTGAVLTNDLNISGSGSFHYDESLSRNQTLGAYAFASWFEDNSDPSHNARDTSGALHPIIY